MASGGGYVQTALLMLLMLLSLQLLCLGAAEADQDSGTVIPAESRCMCQMCSPTVVSVFGLCQS